MRARIVSVLVLATVLCGFILKNGYPADNFSRESILGIKGIYVLGESTGSDATSDGLTEEIILNDVELRLRQNGIIVISREELFKTTGSPYLHISPNFIKLRALNAYAYSFHLELIQDVTLNRNKYSLSAVTWEESLTGYVPVKDLNNTRGGLKDLVDQFINAYLSVNPKQ